MQRRRGGLLQTSGPGGGGLDGGGGGGGVARDDGEPDDGGTDGPPRGAAARGGRDRWNTVRRAVLASGHIHGGHGNNSQRRLDQSDQLCGVIVGGVPVSIPEEDVETDLHLAFRTQSSLSVVKEYFYMAVEERGREAVCSEAEVSTGRMLLHCIGINTGLMLNSDGSIGSGVSLVEEFILNELLPSYPDAMTEEDDNGNLPFVEVIATWVKLRTEVRNRARKKQESTMGLADIVSQAAKAFFSKSTNERLGNTEQDSSSMSVSKDGAAGNKRTQSKNLYELPPMVEWSLGMLSTILTSKRRTSPIPSRGLYGHPFGGESMASLPNLFADGGVDDHDKEEENAKAQFDSLFVINERGIIEMVNEAAEAEFGWTKEEFIGRNVSMICGGEHGPKHDRYLEAYLKTGIKKVMGKHDRKLSAKRKDGSEFQISLGITETRIGDERRFCGFVKHVKKKSSRGSTMVPAAPRGPSVIPIPGVRRGSSSSLSLGQHSGSQRLDTTFGVVFDELIIDSVASIPEIIKELLLVDDNAARERIFSLFVVKEVLLQLDSFGDGAWLIDLLNAEEKEITRRRASDRDRRSSSRRSSVYFKSRKESDEEDSCDHAESAVFYLERVSQLSKIDETRRLNVTLRTSDGMAETFEQKRKALYDEIGNVDGLIGSLCNLENDLLERVAVTRVIQRVLDKKIFSPFALTAAVFDGFFHLMFICAFRLGPAEAMFHLSSTDTTFRPQQYLIATITLVACTIYFFRKLSHLLFTEAVFTWKSKSVLQKLLDPMRILELLTLLLAAYCMHSISRLLRSNAREGVTDSDIPFYLRSLVTLTTPLLWFRFLSHIKMFNKQLATFILCSVEIMRDIKWFMLVLLIVIASFAQMLVSMTFDPLEYQQEAGSSADGYFSMKEYVKAYTIMLGDVDSAALQTHPGTVLLFVLYTFGVCVVLLNILIAIVSESYVNSVYSSILMLGKARVMFVAEMSRTKLQYSSSPPKSRRSVTETRSGESAKRHIDILIFAVAITCTKLIDLTVVAKRECTGNIPVQYFFGVTSLDFEACVIFILLAALIIGHKYAMVYSLRSEEFILGGMDHHRTNSRILDTFADSFHTYVSRNIDSLTAEDEGDDKHNQSESVKSIEVAGSDRKLQRAVGASKKELKAEIKRSSDALRHIFQEAEDKTQASIAICEHHIASSLADISDMQKQMDSAIAASEKRIVEALSRKLEDLFREQHVTGGVENGPAGGQVE